MFDTTQPKRFTVADPPKLGGKHFTVLPSAENDKEREGEREGEREAEREAAMEGEVEGESVCM